MTLRQEYAGPMSPRHRPPPDLPGRAAAPAQTVPDEITPRQPGPGAAAAATQPAQGGRAHRPLRHRTLPAAAGPPPARHSPRGLTAGHSCVPGCPAHRGEPSLKPAPGTAGAPLPAAAPRPAPPEPSSGLLPQVAGTEAGSCGCSVGVLQAAPCGGPSPRS